MGLCALGGPATDTFMGGLVFLPVASVVIVSDPHPVAWILLM